MDNRTVEDVRARLAAGYQQAVLARELSLEEIRAIHAAVPEMPLEVFIHGALCVSYSGRCYASEYCFNRSANRGECAQFCRLPFDLVDAEGNIVTIPSSCAVPGSSPAPSSCVVPGSSLPPSSCAVPGGSPVPSSCAVPGGLSAGLPLRQRHLLSLRDMNRAADLEALMDAGASSFKIEGRLKDVSYVKNITAYYRQRIDAIIARRPGDFCRASRGISTISFTPDPQKSFNRGFTDYFLHTGISAATPPSAPLHQHLTPKSLGEPIGTVKDITRATAPSDSVCRKSAVPSVSARRGLPAASPSFTLSSPLPIANGDGLCFFTPDGHLQGFRINRVDEQGRLYPADPSILNTLRRGMPLFRNLDAAFERQLARPTAERRIPVRWLMDDSIALSSDTQPSPANNRHTPVEKRPADFQPNSATTTEKRPTGFRLTLTTVETHPVTVSHFFPHPLEPARTPQKDNICRQLLRLGDTIFSATEADITLRLADNWFIPASTLADWRREVTEDLRQSCSISQFGDTFSVDPHDDTLSAGSSDAAVTERRRFHRHEESTSNCAMVQSSNRALFQSSNGATIQSSNGATIQSSNGSMVQSSNGELVQSSNREILMTCRYCLRHALGFCTREPGSQIVSHPIPMPSHRREASLNSHCREASLTSHRCEAALTSHRREAALTPSPWFLRLSDGRRFPLRFDCKNCLMYVLAPST